jgi:Fe-coproporphyrin III synthase
MRRYFNLYRFIVPFFKFNLFGKATPLLAGFKITNTCNLRCLHCPYWRRKGPELTYEEVVHVMRELKNMGAMILILEGGEPLLWRHKDKNIKHIIETATKLFPCVCLTSNGLIPWDGLSLDNIWISLDGPRDIHDSIRGSGVYDKVIRNIEKYSKKPVFISTTVSSINIEHIPTLVKELKHLVGGITIQFYYPYSGLPDPLYIDFHERRPLLDQLIRLKERGFPIANSYTSLHQMKLERWLCADEFLVNVDPDGTISRGCYLKNRGVADCSKCGFTAHNEMSLAFKFNAGSIICGMKTFFG